jgi:hypothetical protein
MLEAAPLPKDPGADTFLDVGRQLSEIMPKLHDFFGRRSHVAIPDERLI